MASKGEAGKTVKNGTPGVRAQGEWSKGEDRGYPKVWKEVNIVRHVFLGYRRGAWREEEIGDATEWKAWLWWIQRGGKHMSGGPQGAGGASGHIYKVVGLDQREAFPGEVSATLK